MSRARVFAIVVVLLLGCNVVPPAASAPFEEGLPPGAVLVYSTLHGSSFYGRPERTFRIDGCMFTETWYPPAWVSAGKPTCPAR